MCSIVPNVNLVKNIGFGSGATHARGASLYANMETSPIEFPLLHPNDVVVNAPADEKVSKSMFTTSLPIKVINKMKAILKNLRRVR